MSTPDVAALLEGEPAHDQVVFATRLQRYWPDLITGLTGAYPDHAPEMAYRLVEIAAQNFRQRPAELRLLDLRRHADPEWFQHQHMLGYATYADRFAGTLAGVAGKVDYLAELGVTYLHLMPMLKPRPGQNDGGYAVMDYRAVREDLGTVDDLRDLATTLRSRGISLTLDLVLNHVAAEHEWAEAARNGDRFYRNYFYMFADRETPDAYEQSLPEVFPDFAPGNFTFDEESSCWVWTTFNTWQWDLNWRNPDVFYEFADLILWLANLGVECLRLDAIAFIYKRMGTNCQNQPEVHAITQALRAVARIGAPALIFKAEAIVGPADLAPYLGVGKHAGKVSDLAYQNSLMVQIWSALAAKDTRLFCAAMNRFPAKPPTTVWGTYLRCHDDIGWAIGDEDAAAVGLNGFEHRRFLADFYAGLYPMSDARGLVFQENLATGDRRISGTAASLIGIESALASGDPQHVDLAIRRLLLAYHLVLGFGGLPLLYMGDELALVNDYNFADEPAHADDNRWVHRPAMPWDLAERRHQKDTVEHRVWHGLRHAITVRAALPSLDASVETEILDPVNPAVLVFVRRFPTQTMVGIYNVTPDQQELPRWVIPVGNWAWDALNEETPLTDDPLPVEGYQVRWFVQQT
ncbi:MAG TPA: alpha-amylase family protein [Propionibacteriaceae bacterium]|nr:alpha-amylase family protein [Propionibacteriaceae bacterium]